jgi:putative SOS response-associated peptidase YedK
VTLLRQFPRSGNWKQDARALATIPAVCNLYHMAPREHVERYFRAMVPEYSALPVGPFGTGLFLHGTPGELVGVLGQWGMIQPKAKTRRPESRAILTNNARVETVATRPTYRAAWAAGQRCLIPAAWYQEPNWETGKNIWWRMTRADGAPWAIAGLWSEWTDPATGEIVPNFTMITVNCDGHPLLGRLHKPDPDLPPDAQDKRSLVLLEPEQWGAWLLGSEGEARALLKEPPVERFDLVDALRTDELLGR